MAFQARCWLGVNEDVQPVHLVCDPKSPSSPPAFFPGKGLGKTLAQAFLVFLINCYLANGHCGGGNARLEAR